MIHKAALYETMNTFIGYRVVSKQVTTIVDNY